MVAIAVVASIAAVVVSMGAVADGKALAAGGPQPCVAIPPPPVPPIGCRGWVVINCQWTCINTP